MGKRKTADQYFNQSRERGSDKAKSCIDGEPVHKPLSAQGKRAIERIYELWDRYVKDHPGAHDEDLESLKDFMKNVAFGIDGMEGAKEGDRSYPAQATVLRYWKDFTRRRFRQNNPLPKLITASVTNYIKFGLPHDLPMPAAKRPRRFGTKTHLIQLGTHFWGRDAHEYSKPAWRVYDWASIMIIVCSSSRIGEYFESACRPNSDRGLHYRDVQFVVFWNEHRNPEFAFQSERDAKNMTDIPHRRPKHVLYEGLGEMPLFLNPLLPHLAFLIAKKAFKKYHTLEELLDVRPRAGENITQLEWSEDQLDEPFYPSMSGTGVEKANAFGRRFKAAGIRAGFPCPPRVHDIRAEGLVLVDTFHTTAQRMKYAGQTDPSTHNNHYAPNLAADGQGAYFSGETRTTILDLFRDLSVPRNAQLCQELPAEQREKFEKRQDIIDIKTEKASLQGRADTESVSRRKQLYHSKRRLEIEELRKWQKAQGNEDDLSPGYYQILFDRVRFLMPVASRLSVSLFCSATLRSEVGIGALRDMISLCNMDSLVQCRPGLEPQKCGCQPPRTPYDWEHIYRCYKGCHPDTQFCFLCHEWFQGEEQWRDHCQGHLDKPDKLPVECDPLMYGQVLAAPGLCEFCLGNKDLPPEQRMKQFQYRHKWKEHRQACFIRYLRKGESKCPHPRHRDLPAFDTIDMLRYHCHDIHRAGIPAEGSQGRNHLCENDPKLPEPKRKKQKLSPELDHDRSPIPVEYTFLDVTKRCMEKYGSDQGSRQSSTPLHNDQASNSALSTYSEEQHSPLSFIFSEEPFYDLPQGYDSPLSSICSDEFRSLEEIYNVDQAESTVECSEMAADGINPVHFEVCSQAQLDHLGEMIDPQLQDTYTTASAATELRNEDGRAASDVEPEHEDLVLSGPLSGAQDTTDEPVAIDTADNIWTVDTILAVWPKKDGTVRYLIKWEGFPHNKNTWEPPENVSDYDIQSFKATYTGNHLVEVLKERERSHTTEYYVRWTAQWDWIRPARKWAWLEEDHVSKDKVAEYLSKKARAPDEHQQKKDRRRRS